MADFERITNTVFAIGFFGWCARYFWRNGAFEGFFYTILFLMFGFLCLIQVFALIAEFMGIDVTPGNQARPPVNNSRIVALHKQVLDAFYVKQKGGVIVRCGQNYMMAIEFDGPLRNGGIEGEMTFVGRGPTRSRNSRSALELGKAFLHGETIHYIDCNNEEDFFALLSRYNRGFRFSDEFDVRSGLPLYSGRITK